MQRAFTQTNVQVTLRTTSPANFGVDGDLKSGALSFNADSLAEDGTDDWFLGASGRGVIDTTDTATIADLAAGMNIMAEFRMSQPLNATIDGKLWLDAVYLRDPYSDNNEKDVTIFGGGGDKNYDDPTSWVIKKGSVPPKNDIIDIYSHLRRDYGQANSSNLWVFGAVSTRSQNGDNYLDFEYFRKPVTYTIPSSGTQGALSSEGSECGHTAYRFDTSTGEVLVNGDIILSVNYINGGTVADFRFYAWIDSDDIVGLDGDTSSLSDDDFAMYNENFSQRRFDFGDGAGGYEFYPCNNDPDVPYGYARISLRSDVMNNPIFAQDNTEMAVDAPSWGTIGPDGNVNSVYESPTFIEFALNTTLLGLDTSLSNGVCAKPLGTVIVKTRASSSFTSELKDLAGPFVLGNTPEYAVTISEPDILTCSVSEITLTATPSVAGDFTYEWFKDGQPFDDDTSGNNTLTVIEPGNYSVSVTLSDVCTAQSDAVEVLQNKIEPVVLASGGVIDCALGQVQINGTMSSTNPDADLTFEWTGPSGFMNTTDLNPVVTLAGTYSLTVTDNNNGCIGTASAEVTSESVIPLKIECPSMMEVQCREKILDPDTSAVIIIDSGEGDQPIVQFVNDVSDNGSCPETITRTYSATDACGNIVYCSQIIVVNDSIDPEIKDVANYTLTGCNTAWPEFLTTTWTDNCAVGGSMDSNGGVDDGESPDGCVQYRLYTFTVTDNCGNSDTETTRVAREYDMIAPEITDLDDYTLTDCNAEWPKFLTTTWTDNCSSGGSIESDGGVNDGQSMDGCIQYRLYTFTVTDNCGNSDTETTRVAREYDITAPEIADIEDYTIEGCNAEWPEFLTTIWADNCSAGGKVDSDGGVDDGESSDGCVQYRLYTFTVTDNCGNSDTETTRVAREYDMTAPEIMDLDDYRLTDCNAEWPEFLTTTWADNCSAGGNVDSDGGMDDGESADGCIQYRLYTFTVTDNCGNSDTETTRVAREYDITAPEIADIEDYTIEGCNAEWPEFLTTTWSDNCSAGGNVDSDGGVDDGESADGCIQYRLYTFTVTDNCGNSETETTRVAREYDETNPEIVDLEDYQLDGCNAEWPEFLTTTWSDNCSAGGNVDSDGGVNDGTSEDGNIEFRLYTFTVSDSCGNTDIETTRVGRIVGSGIEVFSGDISKCITENDEFDLFDYLIGDYDPNGQWQVTQGNITLNGSTFNPSSLLNEDGTFDESLLGEYVFTYTTFGDCSSKAEVVITINNICVPKSCAGDREISTALTPNNDGANDAFDTGLTLGGDCTVDVQIFNRWGDKIFEAEDYQNDWEGTVQSNAIGSSNKITTGTYYYILKFRVEGKVEEIKTGYFYVATE